MSQPQIEMIFRRELLCGHELVIWSYEGESEAYMNFFTSGTSPLIPSKSDGHRLGQATLQQTMALFRDETVVTINAEGDEDTTQLFGGTD